MTREEALDAFADAAQFGIESWSEVDLMRFYVERLRMYSCLLSRKGSHPIMARGQLEAVERALVERGTLEVLPSPSLLYVVEQAWGRRPV